MTTAAIHIDKLSFAYLPGQTTLHEVSLSILPGERIGLIGGNGAGKSTLLLCLTGVLPIPRGVVAINGLDPAIPTNRRQLPAQLGLLFQNPDDQLIHATVADDVAFGPLNIGTPADAVPVRIADALAATGLTGFDDRAPDRLSGGEKRRAALAGILAMQPSIILLDEPTSDLDVRGRRELVNVLQNLSVTLVIATHDLPFARQICSRLAVMNAGRIVATGDPNELLNDQALLRRFDLI